MSLLRTEPPGPVESIEELFAIAQAMEQEAAIRYSEIADRLWREGDLRVAEVFERLAAEERGHLARVVEWSEKEKGKTPDPAQIRWRPPETFDDEGAETTDPRLLSAYRSLSMAVRNEERAFAFWSYVVAHAENPEIRLAAERMANEELEHVAALRRERRRAYHAERAAAPSQETGAPANAAVLERRLAALLQELADRSELTRRERLRQFAAEATRHATELERRPIATPARSGLRQPAPDDQAGLAELLVEHYLEAAEGLQDEQAVARAQNLAGRAINRLAWLRTDLPENERRIP